MTNSTDFLVCPDAEPGDNGEHRIKFTSDGRCINCDAQVNRPDGGRIVLPVAKTDDGWTVTL